MTHPALFLFTKKDEDLLYAFTRFLEGDTSTHIYKHTFADETNNMADSCMGQWDGALDTEENASYYVFSNEAKLIQKHAEEIAQCMPKGLDLIELGVGSTKAMAEKTMPLLNAIKPKRYIANDLSPSALLYAEKVIGHYMPHQRMKSCQSDFLANDTALLQYSGSNVLMTGSTISNIIGYDGHMPVNEVVSFLKQISRLLGDKGHLIITQDSNQDGQSVRDAYRSPEMVRFTRDILYRMEAHPLVEGFNPEALLYDAVWKPECSLLVETFINTKKQTVNVAGRKIKVPCGARLHVTNCYKYPVNAFRHMAKIVGLQPVDSWMDKDNRVALHVLSAS